MFQIKRFANLGAGVVLLLVLVAVPALAQDPASFEGAWEGWVIHDEGKREGYFLLKLDRGNDGRWTGSVTVPALVGASDVPLDKVTIKGRDIAYEYGGFEKKGVMRFFDGKMVKPGEKIEGTYSFQMQVLPLSLEKVPAGRVNSLFKPRDVKRLSPSWTELKSAFNVDRDKVRVLMLLSPSCADCTVAATLLQKYLFNQLDSPNLAAYAVWEPIMDLDTEILAHTMSGLMQDPRIRHFWIAERSLGKAYQQKVGLKGVVAAYDIYFVFPPGVTWGEGVPFTSVYRHQYQGSEELPKEKLLDSKELAEVVGNLLAKK